MPGGEAAVEAPADAGAAVETSSCSAPSVPAAVDEHPATAAVTSTNPTVSSFKPDLIAFSISDGGDARHPDDCWINDNPSRFPDAEKITERL